MAGSSICHEPLTNFFWGFPKSSESLVSMERSPIIFLAEGLGEINNPSPMSLVLRALVLLARGCVCVGILQGPDLLWGKFKVRVSFTDFPFSSESAGGVVFRSGVPPVLLLLLCLTVRLKMEFLWIGM